MLIDLDTLGLLSKASSNDTFLYKNDNYRLILSKDDVLRLEKYIRRSARRLTRYVMRYVPIYEDVNESFWGNVLSVEIDENYDVSVTIIDQNLDVDEVLKVLEEIFFAED